MEETSEPLARISFGDGKGFTSLNLLIGSNHFAPKLLLSILK